MRIDLIILTLSVSGVMATACSCSSNDNRPDAQVDSSIPADVSLDVRRDTVLDAGRDYVGPDLRDAIDGDANDVVNNDTRDAVDLDDTPGPDMMEEVCGTATPSLDHVEGQPCDTEGESYCTDNGAYPRSAAAIGWICIRPGMIMCARNMGGSLSWKQSDCEESLSPMAAACDLIRNPVPCLQYDKHAVCCPYMARSPVAGRGIKCGLSELGNTTCSASGQKPISSIVYKCGYQAETAAEQDQWFRGQEYYNKDCESIYAECPYWYGVDYCGRDIEDCHSDKACTLVEPPDSYSYYSCPGVCFLDNEQDMHRCTTTCAELDDFYNK